MSGRVTELSRIRSVHVAVSFVILAACGVLFLPTWQALLSRWWDLGETDGHGFLILAISLFLIFDTAIRKNDWYPDDYRILSSGALLIVILLWQMAHLMNILVAQAVALPLIILLAYFSILGRHNAKAYTVPALFVIFAVPVWNFLIPLLQSMSIAAVSWFLSVIGISAFIDGEFVHVTDGSFRIESGCSGLNFLVVAIAMATLCGHLFLTNIRYKLYLAGIAIVLSIAANWIRIATIVVVGYVSEMQHYLVAVDHYFFGWAVFVVTQIPIFYVLRKLEAAETGGELPRSVTSDRQLPERLWLPRVAAGCGILCLVPVLGSVLEQESPSAPNGSIHAPLMLEEWVWLDGGSTSWNPFFPGAYAEKKGEYRHDSYDIQLYANVFLTQSNGKELVGRTSGVMNRAAVFDQKPEKLVYSDRENSRREILRLVGTLPGGNRHVVVYWYVVGDNRFAVPIKVKFHEMLQYVKGERGSGVVALMMQCESDCEAEQEVILSFLVKHGNSLGYAVSRTHDGEREQDRV